MLDLPVVVVEHGAVQQLARRDQQVELVHRSIVHDLERSPVASTSGEVVNVWLGDVRQVGRGVSRLYRTEQRLGLFDGVEDS